MPCRVSLLGCCRSQGTKLQLGSTTTSAQTAASHLTALSSQQQLQPAKKHRLCITTRKMLSSRKERGSPSGQCISLLKWRRQRLTWAGNHSMTSCQTSSSWWRISKLVGVLTRTWTSVLMTNALLLPNEHMSQRLYITVILCDKQTVSTEVLGVAVVDFNGELQP